MNNSIKAALLSGLGFPGLGQIYLKHYKRAVVIIVAVVVSMAVVIMEAVRLALTIIDKIKSEGGAISMDIISDAATQAYTTSSSLTITLGFLSIILCWIIGTVDAYRIGKKKDMSQ